MQGHWINNKFVASSSGQTFPVVNPATEEVIDRVARGNAEDADRAVEVAYHAFAEWKNTPGLERAERMHEFARRLREKNREIAELLTREGGKPLIENLDEIEWVAACFDYYAEIGRDHKGKVLGPVAHHQLNFTVKEPYGVVVTIVPWNYPLLLMSWKVSAALAAGNTVVIKPSEYTPLSTLALSEMFEAFPPGVVNIVAGYGQEAGEPLVKHPKVSKIAFTGGIDTGRKIAVWAAENLKKVSLELSGNDPLIVCDDVDLDVAVRGAAWACYLNMGQVCTSAERIYVFQNVADKFIQKFVDFTRSLRIGNPMGPDVDLGPMVNDEQRKKVEAKLERAKNAGAEILTGGKRPANQSKGFYLEPAVVTGVNHDMELMKTETFGPVAPIMPVKDIEEAVRLADDSDFGLGASIYTNNLEYAMYAMENIHAGTFWINDPLTDNDAGPFGGMRLSGQNRELGMEGLDNFRDVKHVHLDYKIEPKAYWYPYKWKL
ncbi:MAG TPA: aldehyde dehydrogenase family protein [Acidobacteriota bacterium]|nr:aldehyde dehydrogenase family protein [Acidobacteriota bacterium]